MTPIKAQPTTRPTSVVGPYPVSPIGPSPVPMGPSPVPILPNAGGNGNGNGFSKNCPPGLDYLMQIDHLLIKQKVELMETITNIETSNKYKVKNTLGQDIFKVKEKSDFCTRQCCGPIRCFQLEFYDFEGKEVIHCNRPLNCSTCCFPCCLQKMVVESPISGEVLGSIHQNWHPFVPCFSIFNGSGKNLKPVLKIEGPLCAVSCCGDVEFVIKTLDGQNIGKITKQWSGIIKESLTDADNFSVNWGVLG